LAGQCFEVEGLWRNGPGFGFSIENAQGEALIECKVSFKHKTVTLTSAWGLPIQAAGPGVIECGFPFSHGTHFEISVTVEKDHFLLELDRKKEEIELLQRFPHGGRLRDAARFVWRVGQARNLEGVECRFRKETESFHLVKLLKEYRTSEMLQVRARGSGRG